MLSRLREMHSPRVWAVLGGVAVLLALLPATAAIVGAVILGQVPGLVEATGIALVVCASLLRTHESL